MASPQVASSNIPNPPVSLSQTRNEPALAVPKPRAVDPKPVSYHRPAAPRQEANTYLLEGEEDAPPAPAIFPSALAGNAGAVASSSTLRSSSLSSASKPAATAALQTSQGSRSATTPSSSGPSSSPTPPSGAAASNVPPSSSSPQRPVSTSDPEGHDFFMLAKKQLTFAQFQSFLKIIKQFNQHERGKEETLHSARDVFGEKHGNLYQAFHDLLTRTSST